MAILVQLENDRMRLSPTSRIIKAADASTIVEAQQLLSEAQKSAAAITAMAETHAEAEKKRGYDEGMRKAKQEMSERIIATALETDRHYRTLKTQAIDLVMAVVKKVLGETAPESLIVSHVTKAVGAVSRCRQVLLKVNPDVADTLHENLSQILQPYPDIGAIDIRPVAQLSPGDLIIESEVGIVDASMSVQLAAIQKAFEKACHVEDKDGE